MSQVYSLAIFYFIWHVYDILLLLLLLEEEEEGSHSNKEDPINVVLLQFQVDKINYFCSRSEAHHCPLIKIPLTNKHKHETQTMHSSTTVYKPVLNFKPEPASFCSMILFKRSTISGER
jgi:hypothetical protein